MDNETYKAGLLMEAAEDQKKLAEQALARLQTFTEELEPSVREAVSHAAQTEFAQLRAETQRTVQALQGIRGGLSWNLGLLACGISATTIAAAVSAIYLFAGTGGVQIAAMAATSAPTGLRGDPAVLAEFARRGLQVEVSLCGEARRPCVKVEPKTGNYGPRRDFMIVPAQPAP